MFPSVKIESCKSEMHTIATHNSSPSRSHRFTHIRTQSNGGLARPCRHGPRGQRGPPCPRVSIPRSPQPAGTSLLPVPPFPQLGDPPAPVPCRSPHDAALPVCVQGHRHWPSLTRQPLGAGTLAPSPSHARPLPSSRALTRVFTMSTVYRLTLFAALGAEGQGSLSFLMELKGLEHRGHSLPSTNI